MLDNKCCSNNKMIKYSILIVAVGLSLWAFDTNILFLIQGLLRNPVFDAIIPIYTTLGEWAIMWIVIGIVMLFFKKYRKCGFLLLIALLVGLLICNIALKNIVARTRPCYIYPEMLQLVGKPSEFSYPSGHSVSSMSAALTILLHHKKLGKIAMILAVLMGLSRLYVFVHFPTDVFGGFLIGAGIALAVHYTDKKISEKRQTAKADT